MKQNKPQLKLMESYFKNSRLKLIPQETGKKTNKNWIRF